MEFGVANSRHRIELVASMHKRGHQLARINVGTDGITATVILYYPVSLYYINLSVATSRCNIHKCELQ